MDLIFRAANNEDVDLYYSWTNDDEVRKNSFSQEVIRYEDHVKWFNSKLNTESSLLLVFSEQLTGQPVGQVRFENVSLQEAVIGISIDAEYRGKGCAKLILEAATSYFHEKFPQIKIMAYIKEENISSLKSFHAAGFGNDSACFYLGSNSIKLSKYD